MEERHHHRRHSRASSLPSCGRECVFHGIISPISFYLFWHSLSLLWFSSSPTLLLLLHYHQFTTPRKQGEVSLSLSNTYAPRASPLLSFVSWIIHPLFSVIDLDYISFNICCFKVMWPRLVANKFLRKRICSNNFVADFPSNSGALLQIPTLDEESLVSTPIFDQKEIPKYK